MGIRSSQRAEKAMGHTAAMNGLRKSDKYCADRIHTAPRWGAYPVRLFPHPPKGGSQIAVLPAQAQLRQVGSLQFCVSSNNAGTSSLPQSLFPARLGCSPKYRFRSAKCRSIAAMQAGTDE